jgi:hypothetical protein
MTVPKDDKFKDYTRYAEHCLNLVASTSIRNRVAFNANGRRMAKTGGLVRRPRRFKQMQME